MKVIINPIEISLNQKIITKKDIPLIQKMPAEIKESVILEII
jgi:hypothetical protein